MTKIQDCCQYSTENEFSLEKLETFENEILLYNKRATIYYKTVADLEDQTPVDFKCFEKDLKFSMSQNYDSNLNFEEVEDSNPTTPAKNESNPVKTVFKKPYFNIFEIFNTLKNICDILISTIISISPNEKNSKKCN
uniref:Uncharacterized protein n=1 Tax=Panagrolaimus sp. PS1159 TaxID=55785 RepID=A0AC35FF53_9BILA